MVSAPLWTRIMDLDQASLAREALLRKRQKLIHDRICGKQIPARYRERYLAIRDQEAFFVYQELAIHNKRATEAKTFDRPRSEKKPNRRLRIWVNLLMIAMVLAVVFFSVFTPRLTTPTDPDIEQTHADQEKVELFP